MIKTICYLGTDCSGKDSTMHAVAKLSDYTVFSMPRSPICNIVYDAIYDRIDDERYAQNMELIAKLINEINTYFVWVYADPKCLYERGVARNEKHMDSESKYMLHTRFYKAYFNLVRVQFSNYQNRFISIDNTNLSIQETAEEVWKQIQ